MNKKTRNWIIISALASLAYLALHAVGTTRLPVFADEAIYIRWAQLIIDDWQQYLFFALNDGKTPLFIWLLVPFQFIFQDKLLAGRALSVVTGLVQVWVMFSLASELKLSKTTSIITALLTAILPYWFFHHHLALMDGMLTLWLSMAGLFVVKLSNSKIINGSSLIFTAMAGAAFGLAILSKIPALIFIPSLAILLFLRQESLHNLMKKMSLISVIVLIGLGMFLLLKLHPAFSQLFARGEDFLFSWQEVLLEGKWQETLPSWPNYFRYFAHYLTWPVFVLALSAVFITRKREGLVLNLAWLLYALPIMLLGRVVFSRYLVSVSIFITLSAALTIDHLLKKSLKTKLAVLALLAISVTQSAMFAYHLQTNPAKANFLPSDQQQYLTEWSAGYGVKETVEMLQELAKEKNVLVLSEGYFGTLPDGLLMYLHQQPTHNIFIHPIGQPINNLNTSNLDLSSYELVLLVANSHRIYIDLSQASLLQEYCRPFDAPCHQVWDVSSLVLE